LKSHDLTRAGFCNWRAFNPRGRKELLRDAPKSFGVYAIRRDTDFSRIRSASDIVYIGSATNQDGLWRRIGQFFSPGHLQSTNKRILALIGETVNYQIAWLLTDTKAKAKALESELLEHYEQEHGELPPENKRR
jgi:excinuclease UvrABC nuclease subunit